MPPTERWPARADQFCGFGLLGEFFFDGFVAAGYAENYVHFGAGRFLDGAGVESAAVDYVVEQFGFGVVYFFHRGYSAAGFNPFEDQSDDVNREGRRGVVEGFFFDVGAVLEKRGKIFVGTFGEVFADDGDGGAAGTEIFLRAGIDDAEFIYVDGAGGDVRRHISD